MDKDKGHLNLVDLERMRIPPRYFKACLDEIHIQKSRDVAGRFVACIQNDRRYSGGLLLHGAAGVGKTYMAVSILKRLKATLGGFTGLFIEAPEMSRNFLLSEFDDEVTYLERCKHVDLLTISRFGFEHPTYFPSILEIVTSRIDNLRPTIIVAIPNLMEVDSRYPNFLQSIYGSIVSLSVEGEAFAEKEHEKLLKDLSDNTLELRQSTGI